MVDLSWVNEHKADITADGARKHRQQLFRNMQKNPTFRHVLGTVWKLEYAPQRKFHYHMLFILNGNKAQQDGVIAHAFGEYWKHTITKGKGIYYNCNANKARYEDCCLGKLERGDSSKDKGLLKALSYITKIDACARLVLPGNARTFGRGEVRSLKNRERTKEAGKSNPLYKTLVIPSPICPQSQLTMLVFFICCGVHDELFRFSHSRRHHKW